MRHDELGNAGLLARKGPLLSRLKRKKKGGVRKNFENRLVARQGLISLRNCR